MLLTSVFCLFSSALLAQRVNLPPVTRATLDNGVRVILMEYRRAPTFTVMALFPGGSAVEPENKTGVAALTAGLMRQGTETRTAPEIAEAVEFLGGSLSVGAGAERVQANLDVLAKDADTGLDLLVDVLRRPVFPQEELNRQRQLSVAGLESLSEEPGAVASRVRDETIYAGHPFGRLPTVTSLKGITRDDIQAYYRRVIVPERMILVAVGDFKPSEMLSKLRARFGDWAKSGQNLPEVPAVAVAASPRTVLVDKPDATQTQVQWGRPAFSRASPDYLPARLASTILGGGFTSRLVDEIRVNRSLTYGIESGFDTRKAGGDFSVTSFTKIETTGEMLKAVRSVLSNTATKGLTQRELDSVKGFLSGLFALGAQTPQALAGQLADAAFFGLPDDYLATYLTKLRAVPLAEVNRAAKTYFAPDKLSLILVAPAAKVRAQIAPNGSLTVRPVGEVGK